MAGEQLHKYDLALCDYAVGTIQRYLLNPRFKAALEQVLSGPLLRYVLAGNDAMQEQDRLLLSDREFDDLELAITTIVYKRDRESGYSLNREWVAYESLHRRSVMCVREIRDELTRQDAEDWSRAAAAYSEQLERDNLRLAKGIGIVHEWVSHLRRLIRAIGAIDLLPYPEGRSPTPTHPTPPPLPPSPAMSDPVLSRRDLEDIERMRQVISSMPGGVGLKPKLLIRHAHMNNQRARKALRYLARIGEYNGSDRMASSQLEEDPDGGL